MFFLLATTVSIEKLVAWGIGLVCLYGIVRLVSKRQKREDESVNWSAGEAIAITLALYFGSQIVAALMLGLYGGALGWDDQQLSNAFERPLGQFVYILVVEALSLGLLYFFMRRRSTAWKKIGWVKPRLRDIGYALTGFAIYFVLYALIVTQLVSDLLPQIDTDQKQELGFDVGIAGPELIFVFISLVILPPLVEEIMVRGFLFTGLKNKLPILWAALVTSFVFAAAHLQWGSDKPLLWTAAIDTFVLSLVLIGLRQKTGSLWAGIGLHFIKNGLAFMAIYIFKVT